MNEHEETIARRGDRIFADHSQLAIQQRLLDEEGKQTGLLASLLAAQGGAVPGNANDKIVGLVQSGKLQIPPDLVVKP